MSWLGRDFGFGGRFWDFWGVGCLAIEIGSKWVAVAVAMELGSCGGGVEGKEGKMKHILQQQLECVKEKRDWKVNFYYKNGVSYDGRLVKYLTLEFPSNRIKETSMRCFTNKKTSEEVLTVQRNTYQISSLDNVTMIYISKS